VENFFKASSPKQHSKIKDKLSFLLIGIVYLDRRFDNDNAKYLIIFQKIAWAPKNII